LERHAFRDSSICSAPSTFNLRSKIPPAPSISGTLSGLLSSSPALIHLRSPLTNAKITS
jgi:hypothetical protein